STAAVGGGVLARSLVASGDGAATADPAAARGPAGGPGRGAVVDDVRAGRRMSLDLGRTAAGSAAPGAACCSSSPNRVISSASDASALGGGGASAFAGPGRAGEGGAGAGPGCAGGASFGASAPVTVPTRSSTCCSGSPAAACAVEASAV